MPLGVGWGRLGDWVQVYNDNVLLQHPHNIVLEIAAEAGWAAALVFFLLVAWTVAALFRRAIQDGADTGKPASGDNLLIFAALAYWLGVLQR